MSYTGNVNVSIKLNETQSFQLVSALAANLTKTKAVEYAAGSGNQQINVGATYKETLAPAGSTDHTLSDGSLKTNLKEDATFTTVQYFYCQNNDTTNSITISGNFFGISTEDIEIKAGGCVLLCYGILGGETVTGSTKDTITIASTGGAEYEMIIGGIGSIS